MGELLEAVGLTNAIIGLMVSVFGVISALVLFMKRRAKGIYEELSSDNVSKNAATAGRVSELESSVDGLASEVKAMRSEMVEVDHRIDKVERSMETVARKDD
ncbi:MAG: hypothetical protein AAF727_06220, partial [Pseudomonadota bacterium]